MAQPIKPRPKDRPMSLPPKSNVDSSSQAKTILPGRRQQRHSTEIGCEYHRWWVVRNVLGFETNEHIAGLLLDGFHSVLQQLVIMTGGEMFDPEIHGLENVDSYSSAGGSTPSDSVVSVSTSSPSISAALPLLKPPGNIEDLEEFVHYKSTIRHYCNYLWTVCVQQDKMQGILNGLRRRRSRVSSAKQTHSTDHEQDPKSNDDDDQAVEADSSQEPIALLSGDQCLKSLLSRPAKVECVKTPQFVKNDGSKWHGFQLSKKESEREVKPNLDTDSKEERSENYCGSRNSINSQKCVGGPQLYPTDLSPRPDDRDSTVSNNLQMYTAKDNHHVPATLSTQESLGTGPATVVYAGSGNVQPHPLGTPVFFYPAGGFPSSDNSLASLPALVQNIVYNQSGASLLQTLADRPCTSSAGNAISPAMTLVSTVPASVSGPAFMPLYMSGHPALDTGYKHPNLVTRSSGGQSENVSPFCSTSKKPVSLDTPHSLAMPSSTRLHQDSTNGSSSEMPPPSAKREIEMIRSPQLKITDVRTCDDTDFTSSQWKGATYFNNAQKAQQNENRMDRVPNKTAFPECQGLSGCKLNFSNIKSCVSTSKSSSLAGYNNNSNSSKLTQASHSTNSKPTQASYSNNCMQVIRASHNSSSKQTHAGQGTNTKHVAANTTWVSKESTMKEQESKKSGPVSKPRAPGPPGNSNNRSSSRRHICQSCELVFPSGMDLLLHRYEQHSLVCGECDSRFLSCSGLLRHKETDHPPISRCPHCRFVTFNSDEFNSHLSKHKTELEEKSEDSEYLSNKQQRNKEQPVSTMKSNETRKSLGKTAIESDIFLSTQGDPQPRHAETKSFNFLREEKKSVVPAKNLVASDVTSDPHQFYVNGIQEDNQDCVEYDNIDNVGSESEEPCLVIDTAECGEFDRKEECMDSGRNEQPLCLVVHTRENERVEKDLVLADQHRESDTNYFAAAEIKGKDVLGKSLIPCSENCGKRKMKLHRPDKTVLFSDNSRESRTARKRRVSTSTSANDIDIELNSSMGCITYDEPSSSTVGRDCVSTELDRTCGKHIVDKTLITSSKNISGPTEVYHIRKAKPVNTPITAIDKPSQHLNWSLQQGVNRESALKDCHPTSSLPPKKRGFRKSPRHNGADSSRVSRNLNCSNSQEKDAENQQNKSKFYQGSKSNFKADMEGKQQVSSTSKLDQGSKDKVPFLSVSVCQASKARKRKQALSKSHKRFQTQNRSKHHNSEVKNKGKQTKEYKNTITAVQGSLHSSKVSTAHFKCPMPGCDASFSRKWSMDVHLDRLHEKEGHQLMCHVPRCSSKFNNRRELRRHVAEGHQGKVRRYPCSWPECGKSFFARTHLRTHLLVHTGEKPLACQICDYRCRQRTALIWHMRKHGLHGHQIASVTENT